MIYRKQFIISNKDLIDKEGFEHIRLKDGFILSYHNELKVYYHEDPEVLLLGYAWQVKPEAMDPADEIERLINKADGPLDETSILKMEQSWCGRYVLIAEGRVYLDATGLLGIFYSDFGISSSTALLAEAMGIEDRLFESTSELNWLPGPLTQYDKIKRLLPSQIYDIRALSISRRKLTVGELPDFSDEQGLIKGFIEYFSSSLKNMSKTVPGRFMIALTGGYDSRTVLSLAKYAGIDFDCFTMICNSTLKGDIRIPPKLCELVGCRYHQLYQDRDRYSKDRELEYTLFTDNLADDGDKRHYACGLYKELTDRFGKVTLLRGSAWEVAIDYIEKLFKAGFNGDMVFDYYGVEDESLEKRSLAEYFKWAENDQKDLSPANHFFWEQRYGSWLSSIEQSFDMMEGVYSFHPINSRLLISMLLSFPKEERVFKAHQIKIIRDTVPELLTQGFSNDIPQNKTYFYLWRNRFNRIISLISRRGLRKTVAYYMDLIRLKAGRHIAEKETR